MHLEEARVAGIAQYELTRNDVRPVGLDCHTQIGIWAPALSVIAAYITNNHTARLYRTIGNNIVRPTISHATCCPVYILLDCTTGSRMYGPPICSCDTGAYHASQSSPSTE